MVGTIERLEERGFTIVHIDVSSKKGKGVGWVGGYGIFVDSGTTISAYLPSGSRQTNNTAELTAVVKALQLLSSSAEVRLVSARTTFSWEPAEQPEGGRHPVGSDLRAFLMCLYGKLCYASWTGQIAKLSG